MGRDLHEFADEGAGEEQGHQKDSPVAKRRKLNLASQCSFAVPKGVTRLSCGLLCCLQAPSLQGAVALGESCLPHPLDQAWVWGGSQWQDPRWGTSPLVWGVGVLHCGVMWVCGHCEWMFMCVSMRACVSISVYTFFEVRAEQSSLVGQGVWPWGGSLHCSAVPCPGSKGGGD